MKVYYIVWKGAGERINGGSSWRLNGLAEGVVTKEAEKPVKRKTSFYKGATLDSEFLLIDLSS